MLSRSEPKLNLPDNFLLLQSTHSPIYALGSYAILKGKKYNNNIFKRAPNFSWRERQGNEKKVA
jgi:hypothetical protein